ncbi:phage major capsid protein [Rhodobacteraceae bacterium LMO-12]|nr:phage major capsid protein [Rhodobacteraceae bacterium LMO-JJ12]
MYITDQQDFAARKHCIALHRDLGVKSLTELRAHKMTWAELNAAESRIKATTKNTLDKMETGDDETSESVGLAVDGLLGAFDAIRFEKDTRTEIGSREPRAQEATQRQLDRRPGLPVGEARMDGMETTSGHAKAFSNFLRQPHSRSVQGELQEAEQRAGTTLTGSAGGYVVPQIIAGPLLARAQDTNPFRNVVRVVNVSSGDVKFPLSNADATSGWVGETDTRTETTEPTLASKVPTFGVAYSYVKLTEELSQDAMIDVAGWFETEAGTALGEAEMSSIVSGNGSDKPSGLLNVPPESDPDGSRTADAFRYLASGTASTLGSAPGDNLADMVYDLKAGYRANGKWLMNSATAGAVRKLKNGAGDYIWSDGLAMGQPSSLLGYPVVIVEGMEDIGTNKHPIAFGDWDRAYILAIRSGLSVTVDDNITTPGYVKLYIRHRIGGCVYDENAARFLKCAAT